MSRHAYQGWVKREGLRQNAKRGELKPSGAGLDYGAAAYATNTTIEIRYTNGSGVKVCMDCAALLATAADKVVTVKPDDTELVNVANAAVVAIATTGNLQR